LTDGSVGDVIFFNGFARSGFVLDINSDITAIKNVCRKDPECKNAALILGAGLVKYHVINAANSIGGFDYACYINNGYEYEGSYAGAKPE
jgi:deoxyhypusine synthase